MVQRQTVSRNLVELLEENHSHIFHETDRFRDILTSLRYEGRPSLGRNLKNIREVLKFFNQELVPHVRLEEEVLFPFLEVHIPKLESVIHLLQAEHEDFRRSLRNFEFLLNELEKETADQDLNHGHTIEKVRELGTYLIYLIRSHLQAEDESVYKIVNQELRSSEKKELEQRIKKCT